MEKPISIFCSENELINHLQVFYTNTDKDKWSILKEECYEWIDYLYYNLYQLWENYQNSYLKTGFDSKSSLDIDKDIQVIQDKIDTIEDLFTLINNHVKKS